MGAALRRPPCLAPSGAQAKRIKDAGSVACFARERPRTPAEAGDIRFAHIPEPASAGMRAA
jgi:hypothetical protein